MLPYFRLEGAKSQVGSSVFFVRLSFHPIIGKINSANFLFLVFGADGPGGNSSRPAKGFCSVRSDALDGEKEFFCLYFCAHSYARKNTGFSSSFPGQLHKSIFYSYLGQFSEVAQNVGFSRREFLFIWQKNQKPG
jgi:hypothetical protein